MSLRLNDEYETTGPIFSIYLDELNSLGHTTFFIRFLVHKLKEQIVLK